MPENADQTEASSPDGHQAGQQTGQQAGGEQGQQGAETSVSDPAQLLRVASMIQAMLSEAHELSLDEAGRQRLQDIHGRALSEIRSIVSDDLREELGSLALPLGDGETASESELRLAQAQLVGWLDGLFRGIQAAIVSQQMARQQGGAGQQQLQQAQARQLTQPGQYL